MSVGIALNLGHKYRKANPLASKPPILGRDFDHFSVSGSTDAMQSPLRTILALVLLALPLLEIALLIKLGQGLGFWPVVLGIVATGLLGIAIIRTQGIATFRRMTAALEQDREPHRELADGALRLLSGVLLLLPGPITDMAGALLLVPAVRRLAADAFFARAIVFGGARWRHADTSGPAGPRPGGRDAGRRPDRRVATDVEIIEGEYERIEERTIDPARRPPATPDRT